jgi:hypothetical protein
MINFGRKGEGAGPLGLPLSLPLYSNPDPHRSLPVTYYGRIFEDVHDNQKIPQWRTSNFTIGGGAVVGRRSGSCLETPSVSTAKPWYGSRGQSPQNLTNSYKYKVPFFKSKIMNVWKIFWKNSNGAGSTFVYL